MEFLFNLQRDLGCDKLKIEVSEREIMVRANWSDREELKLLLDRAALEGSAISTDKIIRREMMQAAGKE